MKVDRADQPAADSLRLRQALGYGVGDFGFNLFFATAGAFLLYYYTDVLGLPPAVGGWIFAFALFWDALFDPFMGYVANRTRTRWGRYRPYLLFGAVPLAASWVLIFLPVKLEGAPLILFAAAAHLVFRTVYAIVTMPFLALSAAMTSDSNERSRLATFRMISATACGLIVSFFTLKFVSVFGGGQTGFFWTSVLYGTVATAVLLFVFANTRETEVAPGGAAPPAPKALDMVRMLRRNGAFWSVSGALLIGATGGTLFGKVLPYWFKYRLGAEDMIGIGLGSISSAMAVSIFVWSFALRRLSKRVVWLMGYGCILSGYAMMWFAPPAASAFFPGLVVMGFGAGAGALAFWATVPDTVEYGEWKSGVRAEGAVFGFVSLVQKASLALAAGLVGELLSAVGYRANQVQSAQTLEGMKLIMLALPMSLGAVAICFIAMYPLDQAKHGRLVRALERRRSRRGTHAA